MAKGKRTTRKAVVKPKAELLPFRATKQLDVVLYWTTILVLTLINLIVAIVIIPLLFFATSFQFYLFIILLGLLFGYVFSLLIGNIESIRPHYHLFAAMFIPLLAVINIVVIVTSADAIAASFGLELSKNPLHISIAYVASFIAPYFAYLARKRL